MLECKRTASLVLAACKAYSMSNVELATIVARISRHALTLMQEMPDDQFSEANKRELAPFLAFVCPEVSDRLLRLEGLALAKTRGFDLRNISDTQLRSQFADGFTSIAFHEFISACRKHARDEEMVHDIDLMVAQAINGNIALIAMDRICPPSQKGEPLSVMIRMAARLRHGIDNDGTWSPDIVQEQLDDAIRLKVEGSIDYLLAGRQENDEFSREDEAVPA